MLPPRPSTSRAPLAARRWALTASFGLLACAGDPGSDGGGNETQGTGGAPTGTGETLESGDSGSHSSSDVDSSGDSDQTSDASETDDIWDQELVHVAHPRELRAVWVATVYNINWPSSAGLDASSQQAELIEILDVAASLNLNAVVFQVRPESDALYASDLEPWSRFLTGVQGVDPGWDPLAFLIEEGHARNLEIHAWFNPYRGSVGAGADLAQPHIGLQLPEHAHVYGSALWMDPGSAEVREHTIDVVLDVVERYDVDGVHFDDYFYPYPNGEPFPDDLTWAAYQQQGGALDRDDWRRDNVDVLMAELDAAITAADPDCRFGVAPFGIYRPGMPPGIVGLDQYAELYADPLLWLSEGWVDYLAPQLYWPTTSQAQNYEALLDWWTQIDPERYIFVGNNLSKLGEWSVDEILAQIALSRQYAGANSRGNIFFQVAPLLADTLGIKAALVEQFYARPALSPPLVERIDDPVDPPLLSLEGGQAWAEDSAGQRLRGFAIYADDGDGGWDLTHVEPIFQVGGALALELGPGRWAVSAVGRHNVESLGVVVDVP